MVFFIKWKKGCVVSKLSSTNSYETKLTTGKSKTKKLITNTGYLKYIDDKTKGEVIINQNRFRS